MKKLGVLCVVLMLVGSAVACAQSLAAEKLPEQVVVFAEIGNMAAAGQKLQTLALQIDPSAMIPSPAQTVPAMVLKTTNPATVDLGRPFQVVMLKPPLHASPVLVFSVTDPQGYLDGLLPSVKKLRDEGNMHVYSETAFQFGGGSQEGEGRPLIIGIVGNRAALGRSLEAVREVVALMGAGSFGRQGVFQEADAAATVRVKALLDGLKAEAVNPFELLRDGVLTGMGTAPVPQPEYLRRVLEAEIDAAEQAAAQIDAFAIMMSLGEDYIDVTKQILPVGGSGLDEYLASLPAGELELLKWMPADSMLVFAGKLGDLGPFFDWYGTLVQTMMPPGAEGEAGTEPFAAMLRDMGKLTGSEMAVAMGLSADGSLRLAEAVKVKDVAGMKELLDSVPEQLAVFVEMQKQLGMGMSLKAEPGAITHRDHEITEWKFEMEFLPVEGAAGGEMVASMQNAAMKAMYGEKPTGYLTFLDDVFVYTQGEGALDVMKAIIDGGIESISGSEKLAAALAGMPDNPRAVGYLSLGDMANWYLGLLSAMMPAMPFPLPLENIRFEAGPGIGFALYLGQNNLVESRCRIPIGAISGIADGFRKAMVTEPPPAAF